jgi:ubiquinone/menaquinone biosynthesis C-methylase UbiE
LRAIREGRIRRIADKIFGASATERCQRALLPGLRWNQEIYGEALKHYVDSGTRWLDAGCGRHLLGAGLESIERELKAHTGLLVGVDLQISKQADVEETPLRACADLDQLPFADETFQLITCNMVVEHLEKPVVTFRELARVLTPGGFLAIHTPNALGYVAAAGRLAKAVLPRRWILKLIHWAESREPEDVFPTFYRANTMRRLKALLDKAGLSEGPCRYLLSPQPVFRRFAPIAFFELLLQRASLARPLRFLRGTILVVYKKPDTNLNQVAVRSEQSQEVGTGNA